MEKKIIIRSGNLELEGLLNEKSGKNSVVITHPHPLYGGDMYNPVVEAIARAYLKRGFTTLCFNFRGTGKSMGTHDNGNGEQQDVKSVIDFLSDRKYNRIDLAGYSFGAWVNALSSQSFTLDNRMTMVSPPVAFIDFKEGLNLSGLQYVVTGTEDEIAPHHLVGKMMRKWNQDAVFETIDGADHFFLGFLDQLTDQVAANID